MCQQDQISLQFTVTGQFVILRSHSLSHACHGNAFFFQATFDVKLMTSNVACHALLFHNIGTNVCQLIITDNATVEMMVKSAEKSNKTSCFDG